MIWELLAGYKAASRARSTRPHKWTRRNEIHCGGSTKSDHDENKGKGRKREAIMQMRGQVDAIAPKDMADP